MASGKDEARQAASKRDRSVHRSETAIEVYRDTLWTEAGHLESERDNRGDKPP